jgi:colanic acid/amylovoran biosynthesis glycosyltransferase
MHHIRYEPSVIYTEKNDSPLYREIAAGCQVFSAPGSLYGQFVCEHFLKFSHPDQSRLIRYLNGLKPEVAHIHYGVEAILYAPVLELLNIPALVSFYGHDCTAFPKRGFGFGRFLLNSKVFKKNGVKIITAMSPDMKQDLVDLGCPDEKIRVHYHGIDTARFIMRREHREKGDVTFLIISMLSPKKGHDVLIRAFTEALQRTSIPIMLKIYGEGELEENIKATLAGIGNDRMQYLGPLQFGSGEHLAALSSADVFIHPSRTSGKGEKEGIPGAVAEAMASGLPVITTLHAGIPYVVKNDETGLLVKENSVGDLANAIIRLAEDATLRQRLGKAARDYAQVTLDIRKKETELEELYDQVAGR